MRKVTRECANDLMSWYLKYDDKLSPEERFGHMVSLMTATMLVANNKMLEGKK